MRFTSLAYMMDLAWLREAYRRTRRDGAVGVDGVTVEQYEEDLDENLQSLLDRAKSGTYRAPPVRRVHIPKGSGSETRPIGIPSFEDKVLQRAVVMLLEPIHEEDFHEGSYGFRSGRSAHQALEALWKCSMNVAGGWILDVDIRKFFDTTDHGHPSLDDEETACTRDSLGSEMVSTEPPQPAQGTVRQAGPESARPLRVLWHNRQRAVIGEVPL